MPKGIPVPIGTVTRTDTLNRAGYRQLRIKTSRGWRWILEHRWLWEQAFGSLPKGSVVHHINGNRADNRLGNLILKGSNSAHLRDHHHHRTESHRKKIGDALRGRKRPIEQMQPMWDAVKNNPRSEAHKASLSRALKGRTITPEWRAKLSATLKGRLLAPHADRGANNRKKTHCPQGHPYNNENTYHFRSGRQCIACSKNRSRSKT